MFQSYLGKTAGKTFQNYKTESLVIFIPKRTFDLLTHTGCLITTNKIYFVTILIKFPHYYYQAANLALQNRCGQFFRLILLNTETP